MTALPRDPYAGLDLAGEHIDARRAVVTEAERHVGLWTEAEVDGLWAEVGRPDFVGHWHDKAWCGGYALRCVRRAGLCDWAWRGGLGFLYRLRVVSLPMPGDVAYFSSGQHHAIVQDLAAGTLYTVDGNAMTRPLEGVELRTRRGPAVTYYSIASLTGEDPRGPREA